MLITMPFVPFPGLQISLDRVGELKWDSETSVLRSFLTLSVPPQGVNYSASRQEIIVTCHLGFGSLKTFDKAKAELISGFGFHGSSFHSHT